MFGYNRHQGKGRRHQGRASSRGNYNPRNNPNNYDRSLQAKDREKGLKHIESKETKNINNRNTIAHENALTVVFRWYNSLSPAKKALVTAAGLLSLYTIVYFAFLSNNQATSSRSSFFAEAAPIPEQDSNSPGTDYLCATTDEGELCLPVRHETPTIVDDQIVKPVDPALCKWPNGISSLKQGSMTVVDSTKKIHDREKNSSLIIRGIFGLKQRNSKVTVMDQAFSQDIEGGYCMALATEGKDKAVATCAFDLDGHQVLLHNNNPRVDATLQETCDELAEEHGLSNRR